MSTLSIETDFRSVLIPETNESVISIYDIVSEPAVLPGMLTTAPPHHTLLVLQRVIVLRALALPVRVAMVFSAKLKQALLASVTAKLSMLTVVPCPLPCENAESTLVKVTAVIMNSPASQSFAASPHDNAASCAVPSNLGAGRLPAVIAAYSVLEKSTLSNTCLSSNPAPLQSSVNASPCHRALGLTERSTSKVILLAESVSAVNWAHVPSLASPAPPSKDIPLPSATIISTPGSMVKSALIDR